jgi:transcriptional regulator with XRE-family HTH domain
MTINAKKEIRKIAGVISFAEMIYSYRLANEYSQVEFAKLLGITKQDLCNIEKGRKLVSVERAARFAKMLGMPEKVFAKYALQDQLTSAGIRAEVEIINVA